VDEDVAAGVAQGAVARVGIGDAQREQEIAGGVERGDLVEAFGAQLPRLLHPRRLGDEKRQEDRDRHFDSIVQP
jgi:hypothetical protein